MVLVGLVLCIVLLCIGPACGVICLACVVLFWCCLYVVLFWGAMEGIAVFYWENFLAKLILKLFYC